MVLITEQVEAPLLWALSKRYPHPKADDPFNCYKDSEIQDLLFKVAEDYRKIAIREDAARKLQKKSLINWREFYVGAVGVGLVMSARPRRGHAYDWWAFGAFNTKTSSKDCKFCAEKRIMRGARKSLCGTIGTLVVVGISQPDGRSGRQGPALDPCETCRDNMRSPEYRTLFRANTSLLVAQPGSQVRYYRPLARMMNDHEERWSH